MRSYEMCRTEIFAQGGAFARRTRATADGGRTEEAQRKAQKRASR